MKNLKHLTNTNGHRLGRTYGEPLPFPSDEPITWLEDPTVHARLIMASLVVLCILLAIGRL